MPMEYFEQRERALLGDRFDVLYAAPQETAERGVTVSALRSSPEQFAAKADFPLEASPYCKAASVPPCGRVLLAGAVCVLGGTPAGRAARDACAGHVRRARR